MRNTITAFAAATLALTGTALAQDCESRKACSATSLTSMPMPAGKDIVDIAVSSGKFNTLVKAVQAAGLVETLKGEGPFTVFAPTDEAFAKIPAKQLRKLLVDKKALTDILTYHVVPGAVKAKDVVKLDWAKTAQGQSLSVHVGADGVRVDGANVTKTDIEASNGIIHVIDTVVMPRQDIVDIAVGAGSFKTLVAALKAAGLVDALKGEGPFTVFAPTDAAFAKLPEGTIEKLLKDKEKLAAILTYHVVPGRILSKNIPMPKKGAEFSATPATLQGGEVRVLRNAAGIRVNDASVVTADIIAGNGVIHVIDTVILPH